NWGMQYNPIGGAMTPSKDVEELNRLGESLVNHGRHAEAEQAYQKATKIDTNSVEAWWGLGRSLSRQSKYAQAEHAYRKGCELRPRTLVRGRNWPVV
ncbi:MAG: tetratricopeptide repeat protein, partial [Thermoplasmata archaeon]